jgi:hypothetical protein
MPSHRADHPLDSPCPICRVPAWVRCRALDGLPLPETHPHPERTETTPLYDLLAR